MFDSVLDRGVVPRRRLAAGAAVSVLGHAAVLSLALLVRPPPPVKEVAKVIVWPTVAPMFTPGPTPGPAPTTAPPTRRSTQSPRRPELLAPAVIPQTLDLEAPPDVGRDPQPVVGDPVGGPPGPSDGSITDGIGGGVNVPGGGEGSCVGGVCDLRKGMTRPVLIDHGREPAYTRDALEARVQGQMTVQCVVTLAGRLEQCSVLRPLPHMEHAVVEALMTRRYAPATFQGRPLAVRYVFNVKLELPRER